MNGRLSRVGSDWPASRRKFKRWCGFFFNAPQIKKNPCGASKSVPPGPKLPESFRITNSATSYVMSTGIKIGVSSYTSNLERGVFFCAFVSLPGPMWRFYPEHPFFPMPVFRVAALPLFPNRKKIWLSRAIFHVEKGAKTYGDVDPHFDYHDPSPDTPGFEYEFLIRSTIPGGESGCDSRVNIFGASDKSDTEKKSPAPLST